MCGIVGFQSLSHFISSKESLPNATQTLSKRGPNDAGMFFDDAHGVGLGHRRLSIIDLSPTGHQPMLCDDGTKAIVYNGEVYNFAAIRKELMQIRLSIQRIQ
jgi:asparagine synthase (glutamine-hydrolysing)